MTKDDWFRIRKELDMPLSVFFDYYKERGGILEETQFVNVFVPMIVRGAIVNKSNKQAARITYESAVVNLMKYYDKKYEE